MKPTYSEREKWSAPLEERNRPLLERAHANSEEIAALKAENAALAADQCHAGYGDDYGNHRCRDVDNARAEGIVEGLRIARELVSARALDYAAAANKNAGTELGDIYTDKCGVCASLERSISAHIAALTSATAPAVSNPANCGYPDCECQITGPEGWKPNYGTCLRVNPKG